MFKKFFRLLKPDNVFNYLLLPLAIFVLNVYIVSPLFTGEFTSWPASIETAYIAIARFIRDFWPHISWNPFWYAGYPFRTFYNPVFPYLEVVISVLSGLSLPRVYRLITASAYCLVPVSLYFLTLYLTKKGKVAYLTSLAFTLLPSLLYHIPDAYGVGLRINFPPWRLNSLVLYGEGPHTFSLVFIPLAVIVFLEAQKRKTFKANVLASFLISLVALTNMIGLSALALMLAGVLLSELLIKKRKTEEDEYEPSGGQFSSLGNALIIFLYTGGFCAFWFTIPFLKLSFSFGRGPSIVSNYSKLFPFGFLFAIWVGFLIYLLVKVKEEYRQIFIAFFWLIFFGAILVCYYYFDITLTPQAKRLVIEFDISLYLFSGILLGRIFDLLTRKLKILGMIFNWLIVILISASFFYLSLPFLRFSHKIVKPNEKFLLRDEVANARWFEENTQGERVYLTGNSAFWLNTFVNVPQLRGALDQGATNPWWDHVQYQINHGKSGEMAVLLCKAMNLSLVLLNLPGSSDAYKDFDYPEKFNNLEKLWEHKGDIVYKIPLKNASFAKIVDFNTLGQLKEPINAIDKKAFEDYVSWIEKSDKEPAFEKINNDNYKIKTEVDEGEAILVQMTADPGWKAKLKNGKVKIYTDVLGFMVLKPNKIGAVEITLKHGSTLHVWLGCLITGITLILVLSNLLKGRP